MARKKNEEALLTINELAAAMGVHRDTIRSWYRKDPGNFPIHRERPMLPRFKLSEVKSYWDTVVTMRFNKG